MIDGLAAWKSLGWSLGIQLLYVLSELFMCLNVQLLGNGLEASRHMEAVESSWDLLNVCTYIHVHAHISKDSCHHQRITKKGAGGRGEALRI